MYDYVCVHIHTHTINTQKVTQDDGGSLLLHSVTSAVYLNFLNFKKINISNTFRLILIDEHMYMQMLCLNFSINVDF